MNSHCHFIKQQLEKESEGEFNYFGEKQQQCITCPVPIKKQTERISKRGTKIRAKIIFPKSKLINNRTLMTSPKSCWWFCLGIHKIKWKFENDNKECKLY